MITGIIARDQVFQEERFSSILEIRCCNFAFKDAFTSTIWPKYFRQAVVFLWNSALREGFFRNFLLVLTKF